MAPGQELLQKLRRERKLRKNGGDSLSCEDSGSDICFKRKRERSGDDSDFCFFPPGGVSHPGGQKFLKSSKVDAVDEVIQLEREKGARGKRRGRKHR